MSAFACEPNRESEPGIGWNWAVQAARSNEVWVVTSPLHRDAIERELAEAPHPNLHFVYHCPPMWKPNWYSHYLAHNLFYRLWQLTAIPLVRRLHREIGFDLGHQVTYVTFRHPSFLAWLNIPYIWGPIGGGELAPTGFWLSFGMTGLVQEAIRALSNVLVRVDPLVRLTGRRAAVILTTTADTLAMLPRRWHSKTRVTQAIGLNVDVNRIMEYAPGETSDRIRLVYVGRLVYWKGGGIAIQAVAASVKMGADVELTIIGDGPDRHKLELLAVRLGLESRIKFLGNLPWGEGPSLYSQSDIFLFPSFHDSGGLVVIEAMMAGLPVICLDLGGPSISVTCDTGIRVPAQRPDQVVTDLATAINRLAHNPAERRAMSDAGMERVRSEYSWEHRGEFLRDLYADVAKGTR